MTCFHKKAKLDAALKQLDTPPKDTRTHPRQSPRLGRGRHGRCRRDGGQRLPRGDEPPAAATAPAAAVRRPRTAGPGRAGPRRGPTAHRGVAHAPLRAYRGGGSAPRPPASPSPGERGCGRRGTWAGAENRWRETRTRVSAVGCQRAVHAFPAGRSNRRSRGLKN